MSLPTAAGGRPARRWVAVVAGAGLVLALGCGGGRSGDDAGGADGAAGEIRLAVELYFPGPGGVLHPEPRELTTSGRAEEQVSAVVAALLAGPERSDLAPPLPVGVELAGVYLTPGGVAYVDLHRAEDAAPLAAGSTEELQMVFSLVDSIALNVETVERVVLLWNGLQPDSFAGHVDTRQPLAPYPELVRR